jgi:hypothetical protein
MEQAHRRKTMKSVLRVTAIAVAAVFASGSIAAADKKPPRRPTPDFKKAAEGKDPKDDKKGGGNHGRGGAPAPAPVPPYRPIWKPPGI